VIFIDHLPRCTALFMALSEGVRIAFYRCAFLFDRETVACDYCVLLPHASSSSCNSCSSLGPHFISGWPATIRRTKSCRRGSSLRCSRSFKFLGVLLRFHYCSSAEGQDLPLCRGRRSERTTSSAPPERVQILDNAAGVFVWITQPRQHAIDEPELGTVEIQFLLAVDQVVNDLSQISSSSVALRHQREVL
jgi:hypothetical protein